MKKGEIPVTPLHAALAEVSLSLCTPVKGSDTACTGTRHQRSDSLLTHRSKSEHRGVCEIPIPQAAHAIVICTALR